VSGRSGREVGLVQYLTYKLINIEPPANSGLTFLLRGGVWVQEKASGTLRSWVARLVLTKKCSLAPTPNPPSLPVTF